MSKDNLVNQAAAPLLRTPLYDLHRARGGKMVAFAGYDMPVQYDGMGVMKEHLHTRAAAGLFDVSHMGQALLRGNNSDPAAALERLVPSDVRGLGAGKQRYTALLNDNGGIIDDLMVARVDEKTLHIVVNAGCKEKDFAHIAQSLGDAVALEPLPQRALLALQGPKAEQVTSLFFPEVLSMNFMDARHVDYKGRGFFVTRSGYTGEDGFEISLDADIAADFAADILQENETALIGLGARDSLRLEAGLCLYGHDLDENTTPVEANLKWIIPKRRREAADFPGAKKIMSQLNDKPDVLRVGIRPAGRAPMREDTEVLIPGGEKAGVITSGGFGPSIDGPVAMGYVHSEYAANGTTLVAMLRGEPRPCEIVPLPFVPHNYKK